MAFRNLLGVLALGGVIAAAGLVAGSTSDGAAAASLEAPRATDARELQRRPRPASRLWYRISVQFNGEFRQVAPSTTVRGFPFIDDRQRSGQYRLRANAATLVTVNCIAGRGRAARTVATGQSCGEVRQGIRRRLRGAQRRRALRNLRGARETFSFNANASGTIFNTRSVSIIDPTHTTNPSGQDVPCSSPLTVTQLQISRQGAVGSVSSTSSRASGAAGSGGGVAVEAASSGRSNRDLVENDVTCPNFTGDAPTYTVPGSQSLADPWIWEPIDDSNTIRGQAVSDQLAFSRPPGSFGRSFRVRRNLRETGPAMPPALPNPFQTLRRYDYTLIFRVCGRGGRVPRGC